MKKRFLSLTIGIIGLSMLASCGSKKKNTITNTSTQPITQTTGAIPTATGSSNTSTTTNNDDILVKTEMALFSNSLIRVSIVDKKIQAIESFGKNYQILIPVYSGNKISYLKSYDNASAYFYSEIDLGFISDDTSYYYDSEGNFNITQRNISSSNIYSENIDNGGQFNRISVDQDGNVTKKLTTNQNLNKNRSYEINDDSIVISQKTNSSESKYEYKVNGLLSYEYKYSHKPSESDYEAYEKVEILNDKLVITRESKLAEASLKKSLKASDVSYSTVTYNMTLNDLSPVNVTIDNNTEVVGKFTYYSSKRLKDVNLSYSSFYGYYEYDDNNRVISRQETGYYGRNERYEYDDKGICTMIRKPIDSTTTYTKEIKSYNADFLPLNTITIDGHGKQGREITYDNDNMGIKSYTYYYKNPTSDEKILNNSTETTYNSSNRIQSSISYSYDYETGTYIISGNKIEYQYDELGNIINFTAYSNTSTSWIMSYSISTEYNTNNTKQTIENYSRGIMVSKTITTSYFAKDYRNLGRDIETYSYNNGNLTTSQIVSEDDLGRTTKVESYKYDDEGKLVEGNLINTEYIKNSSTTNVYYKQGEEEFYLKTHSELIGDEKTETNYNKSGDIISVINYLRMVSDYSSLFNPINGVEYVYEDGKIVDIVNRYYEYENTKLVASRIDHTYYDGDIITRLESTFYDSNNVIYKRIRTAYTYNSSYEVATKIERTEKHIYSSGEYVDDEKQYKHTYQYTDNTVVELVQLYNSSSNTYKNEYELTTTYENGKVLSIQRMKANGELFTQDYTTWYEYNDNGLIDNVEIDYFNPNKVEKTYYYYDEDYNLIKEETTWDTDSTYKVIKTYTENGYTKVVKYTEEQPESTVDYENTEIHVMFLNEDITTMSILTNSRDIYEDDKPIRHQVRMTRNELFDYTYSRYQISTENRVYDYIYDGDEIKDRVLKSETLSDYDKNDKLVRREQNTYDTSEQITDKVLLQRIFDEDGNLISQSTDTTKYELGEIVELIADNSEFTYDDDMSYVETNTIEYLEEKTKYRQDDIIKKYDKNGNVISGTKTVNDYKNKTTTNYTYDTSIQDWVENE